MPLAVLVRYSPDLQGQITKERNLQGSSVPGYFFVCQNNASCGSELHDLEQQYDSASSQRSRQTSVHSLSYSKWNRSLCYEISLQQVTSHWELN